MCRNSRPTGDIPASDVTSLTGTTLKMRRIYTRRPDATRELICSHVIPVDVSHAHLRHRITRSRLVNACVTVVKGRGDTLGASAGRRYFSPDVTSFPTKLWSRSVCAVGRPWLHNNEGDSGNCFYVSGIAQRATIASRCCIPVASWRTRVRWDDRRETKGIEVVGRCSRGVWRARARHYASLDNLANDSIEAAGMSSMWT